MIKKTQKNTNHCVSTALSVFDCALFVQVIHEVASDPRSGYNNFCKFGFTCLLHDLTSYTEKHKSLCFQRSQCFLTVYQSQCVPYTVSQQGSSFLRTVNLVFFISLSFIVFHQILKSGIADRGTFTGVSEEGTPNLPFAKAT